MISRTLAVRTETSGNGPARELVDLVLRAFRDRVAVADTDQDGVERGEALQGLLVLRPVQVERVPARTELRPRRHAVAGDEEPSLRPPEREMAGRVAGRVQHLQRPERVAVAEQLVHRAPNVLRAVEPQPELEWDQPQRLPRPDADGLCAAV